MPRSPDHRIFCHPPPIPQLGFQRVYINPSQLIPTGPRPRAVFAWMGRDWRRLQRSCLNWRRFHWLFWANCQLLFASSFFKDHPSRHLGSGFPENTSSLNELYRILFALARRFTFFFPPSLASMRRKPRTAAGDKIHAPLGRTRTVNPVDNKSLRLAAAEEVLYGDSWTGCSMLPIADV
jgi:hypothetical protein